MSKLGLKNYNFNNTGSRENFKGTMYTSLEGNCDDIFVDNV